MKRYGRITVIVSSILLSAAAVTVAVLFFIHKRENRALIAKTEDYESIKAIPIDVSAILFYPRFYSFYDDFVSDKKLSGRLLFNESKIRVFIETLNSVSRSEAGSDLEDSDCIFSIHYSAKDRVSPLFIVKFDSDKSSSILNSLKSKSESVGRIFSGIRIERAFGVEYAFVGELLIASESSVILESSVRHVLSGNSAGGIDEFSAIFSQTDLSDGALFINHSQSGKLFSGFAERVWYKYAGFISGFTGWSSFGIKSADVDLYLSGGVYNSRGRANYASLFSQSKGSNFNAAKVLPSTTFALLAISPDKIADYISAYSQYKEFHKKREPIFQKDAQRWFLSLDASEISCAIIPYGGVHEGVTIIGKKRGSLGFIKDLFKRRLDSDSVSVFNQKGYVASLFGEFFSNTNEESVVETGEWIFIGKDELLRELFTGKGVSFSMHDYILQTKAHNLLDNGDCMLSLIVNGAHEKDSLMRFFKKSVRASAFRTLSGSNIMISGFQIKQGNKGVTKIELYSYADSLDLLPHNRATTDQIFGVDADTLVRIPEGPFELVNFNNGDREFLEQLPNNWLRLADKDRKALWSIPFSTKVRGVVRQVDFFNNGKLQMLLANDSSVYLLDRLGRFVSPFPKSVEGEISLGPEVYDLKGDGGYAIMLLHSDNTLRLYDRLMRPYPSWNNITLEETIKEFPSLIKSGDNRYWVVRSGIRTVIFTINGNPVMDRSAKVILRSDTPVEPIGEGVVRVITRDGKEVFLDLETGNINRRR